MKKSNVSRRKFVAGMGIAASAAAFSKAFKPLGLFSGNRTIGLTAKTAGKPAFLVKFKPMKTVGFVTRKSGTCRMPLSRRPV